MQAGRQAAPGSGVERRDSRDIRDLIVFKLSRVATLNDRIGQRLISGYVNLSLREFRTLATIGYLGMATVSVLARESFLDAAQMSRIISVLIEKELVQRTGSPRRGGVLHLTEAGAAVLEKGLDFADHQNQRLVDGMPAEDVTKLLGLVDELLELAQKRYHEIQDETTGIVHALQAAQHSDAKARK